MHMLCADFLNFETKKELGNFVWETAMDTEGQMEFVMWYKDGYQSNFALLSEILDSDWSVVIICAQILYYNYF